MTEAKPLTQPEIDNIRSWFNNLPLVIQNHQHPNADCGYFKNHYLDAVQTIFSLLETVRHDRETINRLSLDAEHPEARLKELLEHAFTGRVREEYHEKHRIFAQSDCPLCSRICCILGYTVTD